MCVYVQKRSEGRTVEIIQRNVDCFISLLLVYLNLGILVLSSDRHSSLPLYISEKNKSAFVRASLETSLILKKTNSCLYIVSLIRVTCGATSLLYVSVAAGSTAVVAGMLLSSAVGK